MPEWNYTSIVPTEKVFEIDETYNYDADIRFYKEQCEASFLLVDGTIKSVINSAYVIHDQETFIKGFEEMEAEAKKRVDDNYSTDVEEKRVENELLDMGEAKMLDDIEKAKVQYSLVDKDAENNNMVSAYWDAFKEGGYTLEKIDPEEFLKRLQKPED